MSARRDRIDVDNTLLAWPDDAPAIAGPREFRVIGDGDAYEFSVLDGAITFRLDWPHRDHSGELFGQLTVRTTLAGARTYNGVLNIGTLNATSPSARAARWKILADLARTPQNDWSRLGEEFTIRTLAADAAGAPAVLLGDIPDDGESDHFDLDGVALTRRSGSLIFGDAGTMKSYWALYQLGQLAARGLRVVFADFELDGLPHQRRWQALWPDNPPAIHYVRCTRPLVQELDGLRRLVLDKQIDYVCIDSAAPALGDEPSSAEAVTAFYRALRRLGCGYLLVAHVPKAAGEPGKERPFGSQFFFALSRSIWYVVPAPTESDGRVVVGFYHRKSNLSRLQPAVGFAFTFTETRTQVETCDLRDIESLAAQLPLWQRIREEVSGGAVTIVELAGRLNAKLDSVTIAAKRKPRLFTTVLGMDGIQRIGLVERRSTT